MSATGRLPSLPSPPWHYVILLSMTASPPSSFSTGPKTANIPESPPGRALKSPRLLLPASHLHCSLAEAASSGGDTAASPTSASLNSPPPWVIVCNPRLLLLLGLYLSSQRAGLSARWGITDKRHTCTWDIHIQKSNLCCARPHRAEVFWLSPSVSFV